MNNSTIKEEKAKHLPQGQEIDLLELFKKLWDARRFILKVCGIGALIGLIVGFSMPKEYTSKILIAPESTTKSTSSSSMNALASMAGLNLGNSSGRDAIYPDLYPDIVSSTPFLVGLFDIPVHEQKDTTVMTLAEYMRDHQKAPWWRAITSAPFRLIGWTLSLLKDKEEEGEGGEKKIDPFQLTREEAGIAGGIGSKIMVTVEKKTWVTTLSVTMQDPLIAATVADTVRARLQEYVTEYRTSKARMTLEYTEKLYLEAQKEYYDAQEKYAKYADANQSMVLLGARAEQEKLQNEMQLAYSAYTQMSQQLRVAKAKVDEITPVYTIIQPASVPLSPSKPSKAMILVGFVFLSGVGSVGWVLFVRDFVNNRRKAKKEQAAA